MTDHGARPLGEDERRGRAIRALLVDVLPVIATDRDDLAGPRDRCEQLCRLEEAAGPIDPGHVRRRRESRKAVGTACEKLVHRARTVG